MKSLGRDENKLWEEVYSTSNLQFKKTIAYVIHQERIERAARVRACNSIKFETGLNLPPVLKIVTRTGHAA